jgi:hypothetical protein
MDLTPTDFLSGLGGLGNLPHPYEDQQQVIGDQQQNQIGKQQLAMGALKLGAIQQQQQQAEQYQADVADAIKTGKFGALYAKYPDQQKQLQAAHDALDEPTQRATERDLFAVSSFIKNGATDSAKSLLQKRIDADRAAGQDPSDDQQMLDALNNGDPAHVKAAADMALYAILPADKRAEIFTKSGQDEQYTLAPGSKRYDATGHLIAEAPFAPEYRSVGAGDSLVQLGGGGQGSGGGSGLSGEAIESTALSAIPGLVVTSRERTPAHNAEVGGVPNSYHLTDQARDFVPPQGMSLTQAAVMLRQALPGAKIIKENDHIHVQSPTRASGSGAQVVAVGAPKPGYTMLTPREKASIPGLDPNTVYQRAPDGQITAVGGQSRSQLKPWPQTALTGRSANQASLSQIDQAIAALDPALAKGDKKRLADIAQNRYAIGPSNFVTPGFILQNSNPKGNAIRAQLGQIGGIIIHDISGAAVGVKEDERLSKWVPRDTDTPDAAVTKLRQLRNNIIQKNSAMDDTFSEDQGYRPFHASGGAADGPAVQVKTAAEWSKLQKGTPYIDPKGVRRVKG